MCSESMNGSKDSTGMLYVRSASRLPSSLPWQRIISTQSTPTVNGKMLIQNRCSKIRPNLSVPAFKNYSKVTITTLRWITSQSAKVLKAWTTSLRKAMKQLSRTAHLLADKSNISSSSRAPPRQEANLTIARHLPMRPRRRADQITVNISQVMAVNNMLSKNSQI